MRTIATVLVLALAGAGCVKQYYTRTDGTDGTTSPSPVPRSHTIEYRVTGSVHSARISYGNAQDGTTDTDTILPWSAQLRTTKANMFVFVSATPLDFGTIRVQVFVDGALYREASLDDSLFQQTVTISGTVDLTLFVRH